MRKTYSSCARWVSRGALTILLLQMSLVWATQMKSDSLKDEPPRLVDKGVIFGKGSTQRFAHEFPLLELSSTYWTPGLADIDKLEIELPKYLMTHGDKAGSEIYSKLAEYKRQYLGYASSDGVRHILINAFCDVYWKKGTLWQSTVVLVFDGGSCFFQVRYNVSTHQFEKLEINGDA